MSKLRNHLTKAAGPTADGLDLDDLKGRARTRQVRRRAAVGSMAALLLLGAGGVAWSAARPEGGSRQQLTAGDGEGATTVDQTTIPDTTDVPTTPSAPPISTTVPSSTTTGPATTTAVEPTTTVPPSTTTTTDLGAPMDNFWEINGNYTGNEQYRIGGRCAQTTHELTATFTPYGQDFHGNWVGGTWTYRASYCGTTSGDTWHGEGTGVLTGPDGSTITLKISHDAPVGTTGVPYTTTVTGGTGGFAGATGSCRFSITITNSSFGSQDQAGDIDCFMVPESELGATTTTRPSAQFG